MPGTPTGTPPPQPFFGGPGGPIQHQNNSGSGTSTQQITGVGTMVNLAGFNDALIRQKAAVQIAAAPTLRMSSNTGILQADGVTIIDTGELPGIDDKEKLNHEVMIQIDYFKAPLLWQCWLRKYGLASTSQIGASCEIGAIDKFFMSAQRNENLILSVADQANVRFQATCIDMKDMADAPECSKEHEKYFKGLRSSLDCVYLSGYGVNLGMGQILEPGLALKIAHELRLQKPMISPYALNRMKTAADANGSNQKDDGMVLVGGIFRKREKLHVKLADLNELFQRILVFMITITWACGNHVVNE